MTPVIKSFYGSFGINLPIVVRYNFIFVILYIFFETFLLTRIDTFTLFKDVSEYNDDEMINIKRILSREFYILLVVQCVLLVLMIWIIQVLPFLLGNNVIQSMFLRGFWV